LFLYTYFSHLSLPPSLSLSLSFSLSLSVSHISLSFLNVSSHSLVRNTVWYAVYDPACLALLSDIYPTPTEVIHIDWMCVCLCVSASVCVCVFMADVAVCVCV